MLQGTESKSLNGPDRSAAIAGFARFIFLSNDALSLPFFFVVVVFLFAVAAGAAGAAVVVFFN